MNIVSFFIVNVFLYFSWFFFLITKRNILSFTDRTIGTFVLALTQIISTEMLLGVLFGKLTPVPLFMLNMAVSGFILIHSHFRLKKMSRENHPAMTCLREVNNTISSLVCEMKNDVFLVSLFSLFFISVCWMIFIGYLFPSYTWDALWYHLPIVGYIMQSGEIREIANDLFINQFINIFPKNIELFFLWNIIFLKSDAITDLSQLPFTIVGVMSVYGIAEKLGVRKKYAMYSGFLFFFTPIVILQSTTNYVDIAISVLFLMAVNFLMGGSSEIQFLTDYTNESLDKKKSCLLLSGLATGILLGSKGSGPLFIGIISAMFVLLIIRRYLALHKDVRKNRIHIVADTLKRYGFYFIIPAFLLGGYWYVKNWIYYNNPVYPMEISFLGTTIFKGVYEGIIEPAPAIIEALSYATRPFYVWRENIQYYLYDSRLGGLGPLWFIVFVPGMLFAVVIAVMKKQYGVLFVVALFTMVFLLYPRNWTPRYVIFIVGCGAVSFGYFLHHIGDRKNILRITVFILVIYTFLSTNSPCVTPQQIMRFVHLPSDQRTIARHAPFNIDLHARQEYGYWIWISTNIAEGDTLAYTFDPLFLSPLWNVSYTSRIAYVRAPTYREWVTRLRQNEATYILVRTGSQEDGWISSSRALGWMGLEETYDVVYADKHYTIARFSVN